MDKDAKYDQCFQCWLCFLPLVVETLGLWTDASISLLRRITRGVAKGGPGPPKFYLCPAGENLKKSKYYNRTFKYPIKAVKGPDCALPTVKLWLRHCASLPVLLSVVVFSKVKPFITYFNSFQSSYSLTMSRCCCIIFPVIVGSRETRDHVHTD